MNLDTWKCYLVNLHIYQIRQVEVKLMASITDVFVRNILQRIRTTPNP